MLPYKNEAADDYRMLAGIYNRKETRKVSPIGHKDWSKWRDVGQIGYTQKDKQRDERYTYPVVQATSGAIKTLAGLVSSPSCATGAGCAGAAYLLGTGVDDTWTGITNFGKDAQEHEDSIRIQAATAAGVPRKVAVYTDFALDMAAGAAVSKIGGAARDSQLATNSKIGLNELQEKYPNNSVTRESGNWLPTRERVNQNIHELRKGREAARNGLREIDIRTGKYPDGISFASNLKDHLSKGEGLHRKRGISGAHNRDSFMNTLTQHNGIIVREETISHGITRIFYKHPKFDGRGNQIGFKEYRDPKTVYDPKIYSDKDMLEWGQKAAAKGYYQYTRNKAKKQYSEYYNGIKFRVYVDTNTGVITNVHPE